MTSAKNRVNLKIQVHPVVYDFYISRYGETFDIGQDDMLSLMIPHILTLRPQDYKPIRYQGYKYLDVVLHDFKFGKDSKAGSHVIIENRNHLPDNHQYYISRFLDRVFKNIFHNYMLAYCRSNRHAVQKEGILDFCMVYRITENSVNYEMLKKSWDRSEEKLEWKGEKDRKTKKIK